MKKDETEFPYPRDMEEVTAEILQLANCYLNIKEKNLVVKSIGFAASYKEDFIDFFDDDKWVCRCTGPKHTDEVCEYIG